MQRPKDLKDLIFSAFGLPHQVYLLTLGLSLALSLAVHPRTAPPMPNHMLDLPLDSTEVIGPRCPLGAWSPTASEGIWVLPPARQILPFELVQAGYPEERRGSHQIIAAVTCTAYSSTRDQCDSTPFLTASMTRVQPGIIALSRDLLRRFTADAPFDFGDYVEIVGLGVFRVEDTMHRRWQRRVDIWVKSRAEARRWGRRQVLLGSLEPDAEWRIFEHSPLIVDEPGFEAELHLLPASATNAFPSTG